MKGKTARVYTLDELKEKCQKALADPKLVEIVKNAPLNKDGKVNLSHAYDRAFEYVYSETKDLQKTKELAVAVRFLAMLYRNFPDESEKLVSQKKQPEPKAGRVGPEKKFTDIEFDITDMELTIRYPGYRSHSPSSDSSVRRFIRFPVAGNVQSYPSHSACCFCTEILNALIETGDASVHPRLRDNLIELLEEKFGVKVKSCRNCKYGTLDHKSPILATFGYVVDHRMYCKNTEMLQEKGCAYLSDGTTGCPVGDYWAVCHYELWTPKEIPEKKEG